MILNVQKPKDLVYSNQENEPVTNSLILAKEFEKSHHNVLKAIHKRLRNYTKSFTEVNFNASEYQDASGKMNRMYEMTKDGFWAIVMGFIGPKAGRLQVEFIAEFNRRADLIRKLQGHIPELSKKKYRHRYGYLQINSTADGFTEHKWVSGAKTIDEMSDLENHARIQHKRISLAQGNLRSFIADLHERDRCSEQFVDLLDNVKGIADRFKPKAYGAQTVQVPLFSDEGAALYNFASDLSQRLEMDAG